MSPARPKLAFVSTVFLQPEDAGGKIRTSNILRGMKGGAFEITLIAPATVEQTQAWASELLRLTDHFVAWRPQAARPRWMRVMDLARQAPVNISHGATAEARESVRRALMLPKVAAPTSSGGASNFDVVVFDFVHATELMPDDLRCASVCFTHNVEAEIFERHALTTRGTPMGWVWASQAAKMRRYEREAMQRYTRIVAVSERDAKKLAADSGRAEVDVIPTAVDLDFFSWAPPAAATAQAPTVAFTGSMDWAANVDGVEFFLGEVWPLVLGQIPDARFVVIGRNPPASLQRQASATQGVELTGFVDDVRPHMRGAQAFVIPLRVGGGTRIKAFEAMAMGCPVVSTAIGIEGLEVEPDRHYLLRDTPAELAQGVVAVLTDASLRQSLSTQARQVVEQRFGHLAAARVFEAICLKATATRAERAAAGEPCAA